MEFPKKTAVGILLTSLIFFSSGNFAHALTWTAQISGSPEQLFSVSFVDSLTGWAVGSSGVILKTTNGGTNWTTQPSGTGNTLRGVTFTDSNNGVTVGTGGIIRKTTNGGTNWNSVTSGTGNALRSVSFLSTTNGWIVGSNSNVLYTNDFYGTSVTSQNSSQGAGLNFFGVSAIAGADDTGWLVGAGGRISRTTDHGLNWIVKTSGTAADLNAVKFIDVNTGWAVGGSGTIIKTTDGGDNWFAQISGTSNGLNSVSFFDPNNGVVVGDLGTILITTDGGSTWTDESISTSDTFRGVSLINSTTGWIVGDSGSIYKSSVTVANTTSAADPIRKNPYPTIYSISPNSAEINSKDIEIILEGADFLGSPIISDSKVLFSGNELITKPISGIKISAIIPEEYLAQVGIYSISVFNPGPGGGTSDYFKFTITEKIKTEMATTTEKTAQDTNSTSTPEQSTEEESLISNLQGQIDAILKQIKELMIRLGLRSAESENKTILIDSNVPDKFSYIWNKDLYYGLTDDSDVRALQNALDLEGCFSIEVTGNFFNLTREGVKCFQRKHNFISVPDDGYVGSYTRRVLNDIYSK